ncbi:DUF7683 domain-containing protein [Rufibacter psychrotolerans]|uniref:DUF7683 domain-containing protein n=1 Tax=Rufibacter psychrotolerans TaxID=2812556 RepID=UPI0019680167|nr:hypothetical protein [Rufibacter sp. SYSU D00308]
MKIVRQFDVFDKNTEELVSEIPISDFDLEQAVKIINPKRYDPALYDCYKISGSLKEYFEGKGRNFDTSRNMYFLCCYQGKPEQHETQLH